MKTVHIRYDTGNPEHQHLTVFIDGKNCGKLCLGQSDVALFDALISKGCDAISPPGTTQIDFRATGKPFIPDAYNTRPDPKSPGAPEDTIP